MNILVLNPGSSSLKFGFYRFPEAAEVMSGTIEHKGERRKAKVERSALLLSDAIGRVKGERIDAVACRVVHGGSTFVKPTIVDDSVLASIRKLAELAPLHNPLAVEVIEEVRRSLKGVPVIAAFDTAFHQTLPPVASTYALPADLGVRRYGFHGISYAYLSRRLHDLGAGPRLILCHLGSGASVCAVRDGSSVDTSMGFTPMEGLVMGTRAGDLDPGAILFLLRRGMTVNDLDDLLSHRCGLKGISQRSADVRELEKAAAEGDSKADLALEIFAYRAAKYVGAYAAVLGAVDALAFTAGIGEHSASMRERICARLGFLGVILEQAANRAVRSDERRISSGRTDVWVIPTNEALEIARVTFRELVSR